MKESIAELLLDWYDAHARTLPWRGNVTPYQTWVSETMLQQTRVETVLHYYPRFIGRFPTIEDLATADEADVLKCWEGLGYYSRARNLHQAAQQVMTDFGGEMPRSIEQLRQLRGVGAYTAGAIASIAFGQRTAAVDGNAIRVISRVLGIRENVGIPSVRRQLEEAANALVPAERPGDFNQAVMDIGATVCVPGTPSCEKCPLGRVCSAFAEDDADELPVLPRKNPPKVLEYDVLLIRCGDRLLMRQRTEAMLKGLWVFPMVQGHAAKSAWRSLGRNFDVSVRNVQPVGEAKHVFTHQVWQMKLYRMETEEDNAPAGYRYVTMAEMEGLTVPTAMKAAVSEAKKWLGTQEASASKK